MGIVERVFRPFLIITEASFKASMRFWGQWRRNGRPSSAIINRQARSGLFQLPDRIIEEANE
jgi:hypothetical protein